jgi:hypothetical protein
MVKEIEKRKMKFMLRLFRCKMVSVVKYFRRNQFQKKLFSRKYFSAFGSHEKITKSENATVVGIRQRPVNVAGIRRACLAGFRQDTSGPGQIRPDPVILAGSRQDQWPDPVRSGRIPAILARSGRISVRIRSNQAGSGQIRPDSGQIPPAFGAVAGFRQPAVFRWSDSDAGIIPET